LIFTSYTGRTKQDAIIINEAKIIVYMRRKLTVLISTIYIGDTIEGIIRMK